MTTTTLDARWTMIPYRNRRAHATHMRAALARDRYVYGRDLNGAEARIFQVHTPDDGRVLGKRLSDGVWVSMVAWQVR